MKESRKYNFKSKLFRGIGLTTIGLTTTGGFYAYESMIDWANFKQDMENFVVINQETVQLNLMVAMPFLIGIIVFLMVMRKKNREFFKDKVSMNLLIAICILYLVYSVIEATLFALMGAFAGSVLDEFGFNLISKHYRMKAGDEKDIEAEFKKEKQRIKARKLAQIEVDGSV